MHHPEEQLKQVEILQSHLKSLKTELKRRIKLLEKDISHTNSTAKQMDRHNANLTWAAMDVEKSLLDIAHSVKSKESFLNIYIPDDLVKEFYPSGLHHYRHKIKNFFAKQ